MKLFYLLTLIFLSCEKEETCKPAYEVKETYTNEMKLIKTDTTWAGSSCDVGDWKEYWIHMCEEGVPTFWEHYKIVIK